MKYSFSGLSLALCVLLTVAFVVGCGGEQPTEQPPAATTGGDGQPTVTFAAISSGFYRTCGLREDGSAVCWGP